MRENAQEVLTTACRGKADQRTRFRFLALGLVLTGFGFLTGCSDNFYSADIEYEVRTDPIIAAFEPGLKEVAQLEPDQPGQLPIRGLQSIKDPRNPYFAGEGSSLSEERLDAFKKSTVDPKKASRELTTKIGAELKKAFGTPRRPLVSGTLIKNGVNALRASGNPRWTSYDPAGVDSALATLKLDYAHLKEGSRLYRLHCLQCHGVTGNGRGPSAYWVNPHPRDYRSGWFKFQTTDRGNQYRKPLRKDLKRTLYVGVEGTSMPAFNQLPDEDLEALVSYVIHLSIRGEAEMKFFLDRTKTDPETGEIQLKDEVAGEGEKDDKGQKIAIAVREEAAKVLRSWSEADSAGQFKVPTDPLYMESPDSPAYTASILRGQALFLGDSKLLGKHYPPELYLTRRPGSFEVTEAKDIQPDEYKKVLKELAENVANCKECHVAYGTRATYKFDEWGTMVAAANLMRGVYRGGRRPVDIYYRIHGGIKGSGMVNYGTSLKPGEVWDLVHFIRALPYEKHRENPRFTLRPK
ncbi:MAG: c-type cytochrome [Gemmataceae bacterium]